MATRSTTANAHRSSRTKKHPTSAKNADTRTDEQTLLEENSEDELDDWLDEPDFDDTDFDNMDDLSNFDGDYDDFDDSFDDDYINDGIDEADEFSERPKRPTPRKKLSKSRAIVPAIPTALSAPGVNLGAYINAVHQIPILTPEQEQELAHRYTDEGDVEAARLLVMSHLRFVIHIARSYSGYGLPQGDLIQEGNVGLMKAVQRFDPNKGVRLVSFAVHWIKAEIHEFVIRNWRIVKVATTKAHRKLFFNLRSLKKTNNQLTLDEAEAIAKDLNVTVKQVLEMESRLTSYDASFEAQSDDEDEGRYAPQYYLEDDSDPADAIEDADWEESNNNALMEAMEELDDRSRDIVQQRWLNDQKATLHELAAEYNISAERVRQIEKNAMDKIKEAMLANTHLQLD
ncbi:MULTISPECIES: RNA polymerase sigma factor RpoH [unclassified Moraxella]|uniref:RNA polymerase sigma factor RpoH n=1 Tax=unclassified Moraxella TaxID=2685852 RepID=UPI003AF59535